MSRQATLFAILLALMAAAAAWAQLGVPAEPIVTTSVRIPGGEVRPGGEFGLEVVARVREGYHVGANHPDSLYPAVLTIKAPPSIRFDQPDYPAARRIALSFAPGRKPPVYEGEFVIFARGQVAPDAEPGEVTIRTALETQACTDDQCLAPEVSESSVKAVISLSGAADGAGAASKAPESDEHSGDLFARLAGKAVIIQLLILYTVGLMLAFTPCVYPMIPVTVGYFGSQAGDKRTGRVVLLAAVYVFGLALTYSLMGAAAAATGGVFGAAMQKPPMLIAISAILVALALSMFGLFELRPPAFILNRSMGRGGAAGALVMGLIFGLVAIPCVGPAVVGLLAYAAHAGSPPLGFLLFFAMALGIGTPLFFLAAFSAKLPTPGMWMMTVKRAAGFLLLGAAVYFVRPVVPEPFSRYLIPGVLLAAGVYFGFVDGIIRSARGAGAVIRALAYVAVAVSLLIMWPRPHLGPAVTWEPYDPAAVESAAREGRPVMLKFTADWCGICREMEHGPLRDPAVVKAAERFVRLRVDGTGPTLDDDTAAVHKKHRVVGYPTVVIIDSRGEESARLAGFAEAGVLVKAMNSAR